MLAPSLEDARAQIELYSLHLRAEQSVPDTTLSPAERQRATTFRSREAARSFVAGRLLCRSVLSRATGCAPQSVAIALSPEGRPYLPDHPDIDFNLSRTADIVALAVSRNGRVGLDIEQPGRLDEAEIRHLAPLVLSHEEADWLRQFSTSQRPAVFLALWAGKEAVLKCHGRGLLDDPRPIATGMPRTIQGIQSHTHNLRDGSQIHRGLEPRFIWAVTIENPVALPAWQHQDDIACLIRTHE